MKRLCLILILLFPMIHYAQVTNLDEMRRIIFPDIPGYYTLKCDLHMHTVFSDGYVWPTIRVQEAIKDNLDAIAVTEHIEYQPYKKDLPHPDRNRAYEMEVKAASNDSLIVINGSEITRAMPPGHANAIFLKDVNKLIVEDSIEVFRQAKKQGAFVFWNHPHWTAHKKDGVAALTDVHRRLIKEGLINGIEVVNDLSYSDEALQIALDNNLTIVGNSDVHGLVDWQYKIPEGGHRPVTFVFAEKKSELGIKDGLEKRRTVVYFKNLLIGRAEFLVPLIQASVSVEEAQYRKKSKVLKVSLRNNTSMELLLRNKSGYTFHDNGDLITIKPQSVAQFEVKTIEILSSVSLKFEVMNAVTAPSIHPDITLIVNVK